LKIRQFGILKNGRRSSISMRRRRSKREKLSRVEEEGKMEKKMERNMGRDPLLKNDFFNIINLFYKK
jgi:hypothetical protein